MSGILALFSMSGFLVGLLWLLIKLVRKKSKNQPVIILIFSLALLIVALSIPDNSTEKTTVTKQKVENGQQESSNMDENIMNEYINVQSSGDDSIEEVEYGEMMIKQLTDLGFIITEASEIQSIFMKIGINSISDTKEAVGTGIDNLQSFTAIANNDPKQKFYFTIEDRELFYAGFRDDTLYDNEKGGFLKKIEDVHIPETEIDLTTYTYLQGLANEAVKENLNHPSTASFGALDWGIGRNDDQYKIIGRVTAQNSFGVENDMPFSVWFVEKDTVFIIEGIMIDGIRVK